MFAVMENQRWFSSHQGPQKVMLELQKSHMHLPGIKEMVTEIVSTWPTVPKWDR